MAEQILEGLVNSSQTSGVRVIIPPLMISQDGNGNGQSHQQNIQQQVLI
jgi:hypothetical protein